MAFQHVYGPVPSNLPVAVITNGSLLARDDVREELSCADVVMPSLDGADQETFRQIDRNPESYVSK